MEHHHRRYQDNDVGRRVMNADDASCGAMVNNRNAVSVESLEFYVKSNGNLLIEDQRRVT